MWPLVGPTCHVGMGVHETTRVIRGARDAAALAEGRLGPGPAAATAGPAHAGPAEECRHVCRDTRGRGPGEGQEATSGHKQQGDASIIRLVRASPFGIG